MQEFRLALIGFGNVGQGLAAILAERAELIRRDSGADIRIVAICDLYKGSIADPEGLNPGDLLAHLQREGDIKDFPARYKGWDAAATISDSGANVLVELAYTDLQTGEPALSHMRQALGRGMHVCTTNKGPVALHFPELLRLSREHGGKIGVEGTVMSGTPSLLLGTGLTAAGIESIQGILNGTTNFILGEMESGTSYEQALRLAQEQGYAEADPGGDVDGHDAAAKAVILANLFMDTPLRLADVDVTGIRGLDADRVKTSAEMGKHWKLVATLNRDKAGQVVARVEPMELQSDHPLAAVGGVTNAVVYYTDLLGKVILTGPGAGRTETGYAIIGDLLSFL